MAKKAKKRKRLVDQIEKLEGDLRMSLTKKTSDVKEISVSDHTRKINDLRGQLAVL